MYEPGWPGWLGVSFVEISICSYERVSSPGYRDPGLSVTGLEIFPYQHSSPVTGTNLFSTTNVLQGRCLNWTRPLTTCPNTAAIAQISSRYGKPVVRLFAWIKLVKMAHRSLTCSYCLWVKESAFRAFSRPNQSMAINNRKSNRWQLVNCYRLLLANRWPIDNHKLNSSNCCRFPSTKLITIDYNRLPSIIDYYWLSFAVKLYVSGDFCSVFCTNNSVNMCQVVWTILLFFCWSWRAIRCSEEESRSQECYLYEVASTRAVMCLVGSIFLLLALTQILRLLFASFGYASLNLVSFLYDGNENILPINCQ